MPLTCIARYRKHKINNLALWQCSKQQNPICFTNNKRKIDVFILPHAAYELRKKKFPVVYVTCITKII